MQKEYWDKLLENAPFYAKDYLKAEFEFEKSLVIDFSKKNGIDYDFAERELANKGKIFSDLERKIVDFDLENVSNIFNMATKRAIEEFNKKKVMKTIFPYEAFIAKPISDWDRKVFEVVSKKFTELNPNYVMQHNQFISIKDRADFGFAVTFGYNIEE